MPDDPFGASGSGGGGTGGGAGSGGGDWGSSNPATFEAFEVAIDQVVTVGAFVLTIHNAKVTPDQGSRYPRADVQVDFTARNASPDLALPLSGYAFGDGLMLNVDGHYYYGSVETQSVPGLRSGEGLISWSVDLAETTVDAVRSAVVTIGYADENNVVIPLADPASTIGLNDVDLAVTFALARFKHMTLEVESARVEFSSRDDNELCATETAFMVLEGTLTVDTDVQFGYAGFSDEDIFLERPDGVSVAPDRLSVIVFARERKPVAIRLPLEAPYAGTYTFGLYDGQGLTLANELVVP